MQRAIRTAALLPMLLHFACTSPSPTGSSSPSDDTPPPPTDATGAEEVSTAEDAPVGVDTAPPPPDLGPPPVEATEKVDLGTVSTDAATGDSESLTIDIGSDVISFSITAQGQTGVYYAVDALRTPDDVELVPAGWYQSPFNQGGPIVCLICEVRVASGESAHATQVPNVPELTVTQGTYTFRVHAFTMTPGSGPFSPPTIEPHAGDVAVHVVLRKSASGVPVTGVLNLNLHFTGAQGVTATSAQSDARILDGLTTLEQAYAAIGVSVGTVTWIDLDSAALQTVESLTGAGNDFEALASMTADSPAGAVNLIFVDQIVDASSPLGGIGVILGVSGGIPGPSGVQGTGRSAVIVALEEPPGAQGLGHTMAHEVGHYLGLFHSSELFGTHDPIDDTAQNDSSNLMYFSGEGSVLSPDQGTVIRLNPHVTPAALERGNP